MDHAWFAGYAPADKPQVAFAVLVEHGGFGGEVAAPVARQLVEAALVPDDSVRDPDRVPSPPRRVMAGEARLRPRDAAENRPAEQGSR
jgi:hypothetical protein